GLHRADHSAADPLGQYGDLRRARARDLIRAARTRCHAATTTRGRASHTGWLCDLARNLRRLGAARADAGSILLDEVEWRVRWAGPGRRSECAGHRSSLLPSQQPLQGGLIAIAQGALRQQVLASGHRCRRGAAIAVYLCAAVPGAVRHRAHTASDLAKAYPGRLYILPRC